MSPLIISTSSQKTMAAPEIKFTAEERAQSDILKKGCSGCMFDGSPSLVCKEVEVVAKLRGLPDCDYPTPTGKRIIYIAVDVDERQMDLLEMAA
jgi:hypothetical protein